MTSSGTRSVQSQMESVSIGSVRKAVCYIASLIPGVVVIGGLVYIYVFRQRDLITHPQMFWCLVGFTVAASLVFSLLESALMTVTALQSQTLFEARTKELAAKYPMQSDTTPSAEHIKARHVLDAQILLMSNASECNAPIVVVNHLSTVLLGALLPISLVHGQLPGVSLDLCSDLAWFRYDPCPFVVPGTGPGGGPEFLTFFTVSLLLIIFGKIVPEKIGRKHNTWIICNFHRQIEAMSVLVGWLVKPMLAIGDLFLLLFQGKEKLD